MGTTVARTGWAQKGARPVEAPKRPTQKKQKPRLLEEKGLKKQKKGRLGKVGLRQRWDVRQTVKLKPSA